MQRAIIGRTVKSTADTLDGYCKSSIQLGANTYPILIEKPGNSINGRVLEITPQELARIDRYETDAYRRVRVKTRAGVQAWVYCQ